MTKTAEKKRFRVVGVQYVKKMSVYAANVEKAMNDLRADGYAVQLQEQKDGLLLVGVLQDEHPFAQLLERARQQGVHIAPVNLSDRSGELFQRFLGSISERTDMKAFVAEAQKKMAALTQGYTVEELTKASEEFEREASEHEKMHSKDNDTDCNLHECLRAVSGVLKAAAHAQLQ